MKKRLQNGYLFQSAKERIFLLGFCVVFMTALAWLLKDIVPGYLEVLLLALASAFAVYRLLVYLDKKEQEIRERERMLAEIQLEKMRANLLNAISHDLRTPLANINGSSELVLEEDLAEERKRELIKNIHDDSRWLINMIENLLIVSRIDGDHLSVNTTEELAEEIVSAAVREVESRYPRREVEVSVPDECVMVPMDPCLIEQVLINLVENAILHSEDTGKVDLIVRDTDHAVVFTVRDYGVGIPEEKLSHLFDGSIYSGSCKPDSYRGLGIGLIICKTIIAAHHGVIIGRNHMHGAEFIFTLPKE